MSTNVTDNLKDAAKEGVEKPKKAMKEAGSDWMQYIQEHPLQSILFGIVGYFAIKGIVK